MCLEVWKPCGTAGGHVCTSRTVPSRTFPFWEVRIKNQCSWCHLLVYTHFLIVFLHLKNVPMCIYTRIDVPQNFSSKYEDLGALWIYYLFSLIYYSGLVSIPSQPAIPTPSTHRKSNLWFFKALSYQSWPILPLRMISHNLIIHMAPISSSYQWPKWPRIVRSCEIPHM